MLNFYNDDLASIYSIYVLILSHYIVTKREQIFELLHIHTFLTYRTHRCISRMIKTLDDRIKKLVKYSMYSQNCKT